MRTFSVTFLLLLLIAGIFFACTQSVDEADTTAPSVPNGLAAKSNTSSSMIISWTASTDDVGVAGYRIFRDGHEIGTSAVNSYADTGLSPSTMYTYSVSAYDDADNDSVQSSTVSTTTLAALVPSTRYVGVFVAGWHWGLEYWSEAVDDDLIQTAKAQGVIVIHLMLPSFEQPLGTYKESELVKLDHFLDSASRNGVYVMISFLNIYGNLAMQTDDPYYNPTGIEGLMFDEGLKTAFKNRINLLVNRKNTINDRVYKDDPTISAWIIGDEPISAPSNYPVQAPDITVQQFKDWLEDVASYIKGLDPTRAVSIFIQPAQETLKDGDWTASIDVPSVDFVYAEDADMRILNYFDANSAADYSQRLFEIGKPVVVQLAFTSGAWDSSICHDYTLQAQLLGNAFTAYFDAGVYGVLVQNWGSDLYSTVPSFARCFTYTDSNISISSVLISASDQIVP